jgi:hypothetical protein
MNTRFGFMYRDAANWKQYGSLVLEGEYTEEQEKRFLATLEGGDAFIAEQVGVDSVRPSGISEDDHCWHEADEEAPFALVSTKATDGRTVEEFVQDFEKVIANGGWTDFDVVKEKFGDRLRANQVVIVVIDDNVRGIYFDSKPAKVVVLDNCIKGFHPDTEDVRTVALPDGMRSAVGSLPIQLTHGSEDVDIKQDVDFVRSVFMQFKDKVLG